MNDRDDISDLFFKRKPVGILIAIRQNTESYALQISRDVDVTYSHTVKVLNKMKEYELVSFERKSRKKIVRLTEDGEKIAKHLQQAQNAMNEKQRKVSP